MGDIRRAALCVFRNLRLHEFRGIMVNIARAIASIALLSASMIGTAHAAVTLSSAAPGVAFNVAYTGLVGGVSTSNVTAAGAFNFTGTSNNGLTWNFNYSLTNNSVYDSRISSFALNANPNISQVSSTGYFGYASQNANYPEGIGNVEICFTAVSNGTCTGNGAGLTSNPDQTGNGTFALTFAQVMTSLELDNFAVRFQSINPTVNGSSSGVGVGSILGLSGPVSAAPEPATWAMLLLGFGLIGHMLRRQGRRVHGMMRAA
jgi:hypothetical protein